MLMRNFPKSAMRPDTDGINHINIYSKGKTELGKFLSHFHGHYIETEDGGFECLEGYWYWLYFRDDVFQIMDGLAAKLHAHELGKRRFRGDISPEEHMAKILRATTIKLDTAPAEIRTQLINNKLPFIHAYNRSGAYSFQSSMDVIIQHILKWRLTNWKSK